MKMSEKNFLDHFQKLFRFVCEIILQLFYGYFPSNLRRIAVVTQRELEEKRAAKSIKE